MRVGLVVLPLECLRFWQKPERTSKSGSWKDNVWIPGSRPLPQVTCTLTASPSHALLPQQTSAWWSLWRECSPRTHWAQRPGLEDGWITLPKLYTMENTVCEQGTTVGLTGGEASGWGGPNSRTYCLPCLQSGCHPSPWPGHVHPCQGHPWCTSSGHGLCLGHDPPPVDTSGWDLHLGRTPSAPGPWWVRGALRDTAS